GRWKLLFELRRNRERLSPGLAEGHTRFQARNHGIIWTLAPRLCGRINHQRDPDLLPNRKSETLGHHADDCAKPAVRANGRADDGGRLRVAIAPDMLAQKDDRFSAGTIITFAKTTAENRLDTECGKCDRGELGPGEPLGPPLVGCEVHWRER